MDVTFITGNQSKADYLAKSLGIPVKHVKLDLEELQSMDLHKIVEHKVRQAYEHIKSPVIVEDVSLEFEGLNGLPGPFIRFFVDRVPFEVMCSMINGLSRKATVKTVFGYFDGQTMKMFEAASEGEIAQTPAGERGFGWDKIFIPEGYAVTRAQLNEEDDQKTYIRHKPFSELKAFLLQENQ
jgi:non-canonical purine NTP pyrophosphatase (RdgB/HAM1 family)